MVWFIIGFIFGTFFDFGVMTLLAAAKEEKASETAAVKIVTREANVQTLKVSTYVDNFFVEKMPPEEVERTAVSCLSESLAEGIVPFMEIRSEKDQHGNGTIFTAEIKVVDTGSGLGQWMKMKEDEHGDKDR